MSSLKKVKKRDGRIVDFDKNKIAQAIWKAANSLGGTDQDLSKEIANQVTTVLEVLFKNPEMPPMVEQIQDLVEKVLIEGGHAQTAKAYIIYRAQRKEEREKMNPQNSKETALILARQLSAIDIKYGENPRQSENDFYEMVKSLEFIPNLSPETNPKKQLSKDLVLPVEDSMESIFMGLKNAALIYAGGGAVGLSFSRLRPAGDPVKEEKGVSSGPVAFIELFNSTTHVIKKGAPFLPINMGTIRVDHPDILDFIRLCERREKTDCFEFSIAITDEFIKALREGREYTLINPRAGNPVESVSANMIFDSILANNWKTGSPRMIFIDRVNKTHQAKHLGNIETITPGGHFLLPHETCHTGSINLAEMTSGTEINWEKLKKTVFLAVHFLDNAIDAHNYALPEIEKATKQTRKIEIGIHGLKKMFSKMNLSPDSPQAATILEKTMKNIYEAAKEQSTKMAEKRGTYASWQNEVHQRIGTKRRNTTLTGMKSTALCDLLENLPVEIQLKHLEIIHRHSDGSFLPSIRLNHATCLDDLKKACLGSFDLGLSGLAIDHGEKEEEVSPTDENLTVIEREPGGLRMVQEIIPPPLVEVSRVVQETLKKDRE